MIDLGTLVVAIFLIFVVGNRRFKFQVGRFRPVTASERYKLIFVFPLGSTLLLIAIFRLIGHFRPDLCSTCTGVRYSLLSTLYLGWILSFMGALGLKSFAAIQSRMNRAFVIISIICGPFLMWLGMHDLVLWIKG